MTVADKPVLKFGYCPNPGCGKKLCKAEKQPVQVRCNWCKALVWVRFET